MPYDDWIKKIVIVLIALCIALILAIILNFTLNIPLTDPRLWQASSIVLISIISFYLSKSYYRIIIIIMAFAVLILYFSYAFNLSIPQSMLFSSFAIIFMTFSYFAL